MAEEKEKSKCCKDARPSGGNNGALGGAYLLAFLGALVYYIQQATSFGQGVFGFFKALVWPALLVYNLFQFLKM